MTPFYSGFISFMFSTDIIISFRIYPPLSVVCDVSCDISKRHVQVILIQIYSVSMVGLNQAFVMGLII